MLEGRQIAVVVPAYNESERICATIASIPAYVDRVFVVDDASADGTARRAEEAGDPRVQVRRHPSNLGVGAAIATGYRAALEEGIDVVAVMAGDGQMDGEDLRAVVMPVVRGERGYVKGDRLGHPEVRSEMPLLRWAGNHAFSRLTALATGVSVRDSQCGFTAIGREAIAEIDLDRMWPSYGYPNDLLGRLARAGVAIGEVPVRPIYRGEKSGLRIRHGLFVIPFVIARAWVARWADAPQRSEGALNEGGIAEHGRFQERNEEPIEA